MKQVKKISAMAAGFIVISLLLSITTAQAEEVCLDGDTVIGIKDLEVNTYQYGSINIDVDFRHATGYEVYGSDLSKFPFEGLNDGEDASATRTAINDALNGHNLVPGSAGQAGQTAYFIGIEEETENLELFIGAIGSENLSGNLWDSCTSVSGCTFLGIALLDPNQRITYADLSRADGSSCDNAPGPSFTITPGITGSWYDPSRNGEGYNIEIIGSSIDPQMLAYFYTYDDAGNQMWLIAQGPVDGDTATLPAFVASGAVFGPGFDPDDVDLEEWGTLTFVFSSCNAGTATYDSTTGFGSGTTNIARLSSVTGLACP
jgi:hypothetical protein